MTNPYKLWTQADINYMRAVQEANLDERLDIYRATPVSNGYGGTNMNWTLVDSDIPCRVKVWARATGNTGSGEAHNWAHQEIDLVDTYVVMPWDTDLRIDDEVAITMSETGEVNRYQVLSLNTPTTIITVLKAKISLRR